MEIAIREATPDDREAAVALWRDCGLVVEYNDPYADFDMALAAGNSTVLLATDEAGRIVGGVMVGHDGHRGWFYYVGSAPDLKGGGIGRRVMQAAQDWLRPHGIRKVQLLVRETNTAVIAFYEKLGFEVSSRVVMSRWLD